MKNVTDDSQISDLGNKIFWEFNPHKTLPFILPQTYRLDRITKPPIYISKITNSPDLQKHLAHKVIKLIDSTQEKYLSLKITQETDCGQTGLIIKSQAMDLLRQIDKDLTRPKGFQVVTGAQVRLIITEALEWNHAVITWIVDQQQSELERQKMAQKVAPPRMTDAQKLEALKRAQATVSPMEPNKNWSPSVANAAKKLMLAIAQREEESLTGSSPK